MHKLDTAALAPAAGDADTARKPVDRLIPRLKPEMSLVRFTALAFQNATSRLMPRRSMRQMHEDLEREGMRA